MILLLDVSASRIPEALDWGSRISTSIRDKLDHLRFRLWFRTTTQTPHASCSCHPPNLLNCTPYGASMKADYIGGISLRLALDKDQTESLTGLVVEMLADKGIG